jgi:LysR family transcriptional regulator, benzoate and cis,cis-muconate-responsive activator of ben and cat genes
MRRPSLREIECFVAVAEELHFSRAATRLHLSQPPLSRHIQQLEDALGVPLLLRDKRSVSLTSAGQLFLTDARDILFRLDRACDGARRAATGEVRRLTLGFVGALLAPDLISLLQQYRWQYPQVQVQLLDMLPAEQLSGLKAGTVDGAFLGAPPRRLSQAFAAMIWKKEMLLLGFPEKHSRLPEAGKGIRLKTLRDESWVMVSRRAAPAFRNQVDELCQSAGFRPRITQESDRVQAVLSMVAVGSGISLFPETVTHLISTGVAFRQLIGCDPTLAHSFVFPANRVSPELDAFHNLILKSTKKNADKRRQNVSVREEE